MKKPLVSLMAAGAAMALLVGCSGQSTPSSDSSSNSSTNAAANYELINPGKLTIGLSPDYPPVAYMEGNDIVGADADLAREIAKRLGLEAEFVPSAWDQLINSVQTGRIDVIMSGMTDTPERQQTADFVDYNKSESRFYTTPDQADKYKKDSDVCGAAVALSTKAVSYQPMLKFNEDVCVKAGLEPVKIVGTDAGAAARLQLDQGRAQLAVQGYENIAYFLLQDPESYKVVLGPLQAEPTGIAVKKGNMGLTEAIQKVLKEMYDDGTSKKIQAKYNLDGVIEPTINAGK